MNLDRNNTTVLNVKISEVCVKSNFLKIYAQNVDSVGYQNIQGLEQIYTTLKCDPIAIGDVCMLKSEGCCYRSRVLSINNEQASLYLIDWGFYATFPAKLLRLIPQNHPLFSMPPACKEYFVGGIKIDTSVADFKEKIRNTAYKILRNKFAQITVAGELAPIAPCVHIEINNFSFAKELVPQDPIMGQVFKQIRIVDQLSDLNDVLKDKEPDLLRVSREESPEEGELLSQSFGTKTFEVGSTHQVQIVGTEPTPGEFYVHFTQDIMARKEFMDAMRNVDLSKIKTMPSIGSKCVAMIYLESTKRLEVFRVIVKGIGCDGVKIYLVDKGTEMVIDFAHLYMTSDRKAIETPPYAAAFSLHKFGDITHISAEERDFYFRYLTRNRHLQLTVKESKNHTPECSLKDFYRNEDILTLMEAYDPRAMTYPEQLPLELGTKQKVQITAAQSHESFYITLADHIQYVKSTGRTLRRVHACELKCPSPGNVCYVKEDEKFYRAKYIKRISPSTCEVLLVDTGNVCEVNYEDIKVMVPNHLQNPPFAYNCSLVDEESLHFESYLNKFALIDVIDFKDEKYVVKILDYSDRLEGLSAEPINDSWSIHSFNDYDVCRISYVNSINYFTIQSIARLEDLEKAKAEWQRIIGNIQNLSMRQEKFKKEEIYITKDKFDDKFIRVALFKDGENVKIFRNIDDGSLIEIDESREIFAAPFDITLTPPFGIPCSLPCYAKTGHEQEADEFLMNYSGKDLTYNIVNCGFDCNIIELFHGHQCITAEMRKLDFVKKISTINTGYGYIHYIYNLKEFYMQDENDKEKLREIIRHASKYQRIPIEKPKKNMIVWAKYFRDDTWNRAKILWETADRKFLVEYIDFGNRYEVELNEIGMIENLFVANTEPIAVQCGLDLPENFDPNSSEANDEFNKFAFKLCPVVRDENKLCPAEKDASLFMPHDNNASNSCPDKKEVSKDAVFVGNFKFSRRVKYEFLRMDKSKNIVKLFEGDNVVNKGTDLLARLQGLCKPYDLKEDGHNCYASFSSLDDDSILELPAKRSKSGSSKPTASSIDSELW